MNASGSFFDGFGKLSAGLISHFPLAYFSTCHTPFNLDIFAHMHDIMKERNTHFLDRNFKDIYDKSIIKYNKL